MENASPHYFSKQENICGRFYHSKIVRLVAWGVQKPFTACPRRTSQAQSQKAPPALVTIFICLKYFNSLGKVEIRTDPNSPSASREMVIAIISYLSEHATSSLSRAVASLAISYSSIQTIVKSWFKRFI